jgi:hypothetical protein
LSDAGYGSGFSGYAGDSHVKQDEAERTHQFFKGNSLRTPIEEPLIDTG